MSWKRAKWGRRVEGRGRNEVEEDNIDPLVAPPLLTRRRHHYIIHHPSIYWMCAHTYGCKPTRPQTFFGFSTFSLLAAKISFSFYFSTPYCPLLSYFIEATLKGIFRGCSQKQGKLSSVGKVGMWEAATRGATSLKINSVKEPPDIRGFAKDLTPQDPTSECASIHNS